MSRSMPLRPSRSHPSSSSSPAIDQDGGAGDRRRILFVGNLSYQTTRPSLLAHFSAAGEVEHLDHRAEKGYAFVTYEDAVCARSAIRHIHETRLDGRALTVQWKGAPARKRDGAAAARELADLPLETVLTLLRELRECHPGAVRTHLLAEPRQLTAQLLEWQRRHLTLVSEESRDSPVDDPTVAHAQEVVRATTRLPTVSRGGSAVASAADVDRVLRNFRRARGPCCRRAKRRQRLNLYQRRQLRRKTNS